MSMRYRVLVGDGDSSAYNAVKNMNDGKGPYKNTQGEKQECLNHIKFFCLRTCQYSISNTVLQHNYGYTTASMISELGLQARSNITTEYFQDKDKKRKRGANRTPRKKSKKEDQDISYASGAY
ncbi:hypothetical protein Pcinc_017443 [Petrolisthes cinctipes]|uniref:GIY-YIG homing endonuclease n=1 Tax=Petrolisthes cinctipes TaxID=88211 RepID=A0AAE1FP73_PETCI|nr:hypothetical protein Pcinc_017443 [Petrolisthes cinctipes]